MIQSKPLTWSQHGRARGRRGDSRGGGGRRGGGKALPIQIHLRTHRVTETGAQRGRENARREGEKSTESEGKAKRE